MGKIVLDVSEEAFSLATKHAQELGYPHAADYAYELLRNHCTSREDALYTRMHTGEQNPVFGPSLREQVDLARRKKAEDDRAEEERKKASAVKPSEDLQQA